MACGFCGVKISHVIGYNTINIPDIFYGNIISAVNFLSQGIYSFVNNPRQIIDERTLGHVHLQGKRFSTVFLLFAF